jgi:Short C-terminal domain
VGIFSIWVNRQALNTDNWVSTSDKLLQNEAVQTRLADYLAEQLFENVDVQAELEATLPPRLAPLAGPAAGALHQLAPQVAQRALSAPKFESLWSTANRAAHETLLKIVDGGGSTVSTNGGEVVLDLNSLLTQIGGQLGGNLASKVPAEAGKLTILKSDQLSTAQDVVGLIRHLPIVLTLLAFLLYALAIYLAGPRRREALRGVGFSFLIAGLLVLVLRHFGGSAVTDALAKSESVKPAVDAVWSIATSLLVTVAVSAITFGILLVIGAWLAGPTRLATNLRRDAAQYLRERVAATYAVVALIFLALILWAPVVAFHKLIGLLILAVLMVLGTEVLRRQAAAEFPDASFGGLGDRVRASVPGRATKAPAKQTKIDEIERLSDLKDKGALTEQEFESAKAEVLGGD